MPLRYFHPVLGFQSEQAHLNISWKCLEMFGHVSGNFYNGGHVRIAQRGEFSEILTARRPKGPQNPNPNLHKRKQQ